MHDIPADWYINRTLTLSAELAEAHKGMATMAASLRQAREELTQARADLHDATTGPVPGSVTDTQEV